MSSATPPQPDASLGANRKRSFIQRRPITAFLLLALGIGCPGLVIPLLAEIPLAPFLLLLVFVVLLGSALLITRIADGPGSVRKLLSRAFQWRFSAGRWAVIVFGIPVLTIALAAASGTLTNPERGWAAEIGWYLFNTFIFGALTLNLWEETAWSGFAQSRLMAQHGLLVGSLITAVFFAAIHVPLQFQGDPTGSQIVVGLVMLFAVTPIYRYLLGMHLLDTGGSILAVGVQHASWNAAQKLEAVEGGNWAWQMVAATALLTLILAVFRRLRRPRSRQAERNAEKAAAAQWIAPPASAAQSPPRAEPTAGSRKPG